jgi:Mg2+-importing ATPase
MKTNKIKKVLIALDYNPTAQKVAETGFTNPIDKAILDYSKIDLSGYLKLDEIPYDFLRKRLSIAVKSGDSQFMVTKGALDNILEVCSSAGTKDDNTIEIISMQDQIQKHFAESSNRGFAQLVLLTKKWYQNH